VRNVTEKSIADQKKVPRGRRREMNGSVAARTDLERRRALGQFFTPPAVARFIWDMVEHFRGQNWPNRARVIDPACGQGVFLHAALERGRSFDLYGADIDESLMPDWRADLALKDARLHVANGLVDDPGVGLESGTFDVVVGNPPFASTGLKDLMRLLDARRSKTASQIELFGSTPEPINVGPEPLAAHVRAGLDRLVRELSHYVCWRLRPPPGCEDWAEADGGPTALFDRSSLAPNGDARDSAHDRAARSIAEWPADRPLDVRRADVRSAIQRMASIPIEVYFVERFVHLAKPGGAIAMIIPENILASDQLAPLRTWLMEQAQLLAIVSLPQKVFTGVGANAKTGIVFAYRFTKAERRQIERMPAADSSARLPRAWRDRQVYMAAPKINGDGWNLSDYLAEVLANARNRVAPAAKG
jgi:predicted RNA methylase